MPNVARELSIQYGTVETGGSTDYLIDGKPRLTYGPSTAMVEWRVLVTGSSESNFQSNLDTLEAEFAKRFQRLTWKYGTTTFLDFNPSDDSGYNQVPTITKDAGGADTGRSRIYVCRVDVEMPADDNSGRSESTVEVDYDTSSIGTCTISGVYTAQGGTAARANYASKIGAYESGILSGLGGTWELINDNATTDDQDKVCSFSRVHREIAYPQASGVTDHAAIKNTTVEFRRTTSAPGDTPGGRFGDARRLHFASALYACSVDKSVSTSLATLWKNTIRPYVISQAKSIFGASIVCVVSEEPTYDKSNNAISGTLQIQMVIQGATVFSYTAEQDIDADSGIQRRGIYVKGRPYTKRLYQGEANTTRTTTIRYTSSSIAALQKVRGVNKLAEGEKDGKGDIYKGGIPAHQGWISDRKSTSKAPKRVGLPGIGGQFINATEQTEVYVDFWADADTSGTGGGGTARGSLGRGSLGSGGPSVTPRSS